MKTNSDVKKWNDSIRRIATGVAFAAIAALVSACGSSSGVAASGLGASVLNGQGCTGYSQAIAFSGIAEMDGYGNIYAGPQVGQLMLSATGAVQGGGYQFGRINTTDGSVLEFNLSGSYGSQIQIQGEYIMGQDVMTVLETMGSSMSYSGYGYGTTGYGYGTTGYGSTGCGVSSLAISQMGTEPMTEAESVIGQQPFTYALVSGELILNNSYPAPY